MLKPVDKKYRENMNQMKTERKTTILYTENIKHMYHPDSVYTVRLHTEMFLTYGNLPWLRLCGEV